MTSRTLHAARSAVTRRTLVLAGAAGAALGPLLVAPDVFAAATSRRDLYTRSRFRALRGRSFRLEGGGRTWRVRLTRVRDVPHAPRRDAHRFSLTFTSGVPGPEQGSYVLRRQGFRATTLFVVPSDAARRTYEVIVLGTPHGRA